MESFEQESQMPETPGGGDEIAVKTDHEAATDAQPSASTTDRFGLQKNGKGYLLRKYNIATSKAGLPYFEPIQSMLKQFVLDADDVFNVARTRFKTDEELQQRVEALGPPVLSCFEAFLEDAGEGREWLARSFVIWPLTDQVGYQLYKAASGEADLLDYGVYLIRTDANINAVEDLADHAQFQKRQYWTDLAYKELGIIDALIGEVDPDSLKYNVEAIVRSGYQSAANLDTRNHLRGVAGETPLTEDTESVDIKKQILASRRVTSQVA